MYEKLIDYFANIVSTLNQINLMMIVRRVHEIRSDHTQEAQISCY